MRLQKDIRTNACFPIDIGAFSPDAIGTPRRLGPKNRRDSENRSMKNSILYCIAHPDCGCAGLCIGSSGPVTLLTNG
jgi:hypothetical protein